MAHSEEGQRELGVQAETEPGFDEALRKAASGWMRWRNQPDSEQREAIARAETAVVSEVRRRWGGAAVARLRQLELQGQGARAFLRTEVADHLAITTDQRSKFDALFERSDLALGRVRSIGSAGRAQRQTAMVRIRQIESEAARQILSAGQQSRWLECLGDVRDTSAFERVLPMAPELVDSGVWVDGERKARWVDLRGKVVLLHFYAFQCHNCHANFSIYNRWNSTLRDHGIEVVGVQTPETDDERDAGKVVAAAKKAGFEFPVLVDLKSANWDAWGTTMWPTVYVIDRRGYVRHWWMGELRWKGAQGDQEIERLAKRLSA
jgi:peroxiredoxin